MLERMNLHTKPYDIPQWYVKSRESREITRCSMQYCLVRNVHLKSWIGSKSYFGWAFGLLELPIPFNSSIVVDRSPLQSLCSPSCSWYPTTKFILSSAQAPHLRPSHVTRKTVWSPAEGNQSGKGLHIPHSFKHSLDCKSLSISESRMKQASLWNPMVRKMPNLSLYAPRY